MMSVNYKYKTLSNFRKAHLNEYNYLRYKGLLKQLCLDMGWEYSEPKKNIKPRKPLSSWTYEECFEIAKKYNNKKNWCRESSGSYTAAKKNGWLHDCTAHMTNTSKPKGYWTRERCLEEALKYKTRNEWKKNHQASYEGARTKEWYSECVVHMSQRLLPPNHWTKERIKLEMSKCNTLKEFIKVKGGSNALKKAKENGWYEEFSAHMNIRKITRPKIVKKSGHWNKENFKLECEKYDSYSKLREANPSAIECARSKGFLDETIAIFNWKRQKNKSKNTIWTKEECLEIALTFDSKVAWEKGHNKSLSAARRKGWFDECSAHMTNLIRSSGYWTKEKCLENALLYDNKEKWKKENYSANASARRNGWYFECTSHMVSPKKPINYWTRERCLEEALKYKTRNEWNKKHQTSYNKAKKYGWYDDCVAHMVLIKKEK